MQLVGYQIRCFEELYSGLVNDGRQFILFTGPKGCGKSAVSEELADSLKENWQVFLIAGTGMESPPYYTWYSASHKLSNQEKTRITDVSFGVNFEPIGLPVGLEISLALSSGESVLFNSNEQAILKSIYRKAEEKENILLIAEDYSSWDPASKTLLMKMAAARSSVFGEDKFVHIVLVDSSLDNTDIAMGYAPFKIHINDISFNDIEQIVGQQPYIKALQVHDLERIVQFTGYDLRLINLAVHYHQESPESSKIHSLEELLEKRISYMPKEQQNVCRTLECVSIINTLFSEKEAAYLLDQELIHTERVLDEAASLQLIRKRYAYDFPNLEIQRYFEAKLDTEKKYLHYRFAQYLQNHFPEDYFSRAYHLFLSEEAYSEHNILEAAYLMVIEIVRRKELTGGAPELVLDERLNEIIKCLPQSIDQVVKKNISSFMEGNYLLNQCNYLEAALHFNSLHFMYATKAFSIEALRLLLLSYVQLADDLYEIKRVADDLYNSISDLDLHEDELWCRSALLLLEVYGDRHIQLDRFQLLKSGFDTRIRKHMYQSAFRTLHARYACKATLFFNSVISVKLTEESCEYYRTYNSIINLYFSLCNNAANRIVCGEYEEAKKRLQECKEIINENPDIRFPSTYKIENNIVLNTFLQSEGVLFDYQSRRKEIILSAASQAVGQLENIRGQQGYEVSHVIEFNLLSMFMLIGNENKTSDMLRNFRKEYKHLDAFYRYYYHNACCSHSLLTGNFTEAIEHLEILENLEVILLSGSTKILNKRNQILHQLLDERFQSNAFDYNYEFIRRGFHIQDPSASFWGRGFLLSDLQFLSL